MKNKVGRPRKTAKITKGVEIMDRYIKGVIPTIVDALIDEVDSLQRSVNRMRIAIWAIVAGLSLLTFAHIQLVNQLVAIINTVK